MGWMTGAKRAGDLFAVKCLLSTGVSTSTVRWGRRAVSPQTGHTVLVGAAVPCCASAPPAAADPKPQKQRPGRSYLTLLLSPQVLWTNKKGFSVKRSRKALFLVLIRCREMRRFLEQERLCLFPRFLKLVL